MKLVELRYDKTSNLGNYESEKVGATCQLADNDDATKALQKLIEFVISKGQMAIKVEETKSKPPEAGTEVSEAIAQIADELDEQEQMDESWEDEEPVVAPRKRGRPTKPKPEPKPAPFVAPKPEPKPEPKPTPIPAPAPAPVPAKKATPYNRAIELHKKLMAQTLDRHIPGWKSNAGKAKAASERLEGTLFLDGEGKVLESFIEAIKKEMGV